MTEERDHGLRHDDDNGHYGEGRNLVNTTQYPTNTSLIDHSLRCDDRRNSLSLIDHRLRCDGRRDRAIGSKIARFIMNCDNCA